MIAINYSIGLGLYRVVLCFLVIKNMCFYLPMATDLFGPNAIFPYVSYQELLTINHLNFLAYPFYIPYASQLFIVLVILLASCYMLGYGGRLSGILLFLSLFILKLRNGFILDGSDNVMQVTLPFLILADDQTFLGRNSEQGRANLYFNKIKDFALVGFMIQICFVYFFTSLAKLQGNLWLNGTAVYYTMRVKEFMATPWNIQLTENHYFVVLSTYFTVLWEMSFPFLVWFRQTKYWILAFGIVLHIGIWVFMRIDNFSWIMIGSYFVFLSNTEYNSIFGRYQPGKLVVFIDTWCANCVRVGRLIQRVDFWGFVKLEDARRIKDSTSQGLVDEQLALNRMATIINGNVYYGFSSINQLVLSLPVLWLFLPFLFLLKILNVGDWLYDELAVRRKLIPIHCSEKVCELNQ